MARRNIVANVKEALKCISFPTANNFMDVIRAVSAMPLAKLHVLYQELFGEAPTVTQADGTIVPSPNRKQLVRLCQYGVQSVCYGGNLPAEVVEPTTAAMDEELVAESPKTSTRVARGPTIKSLVLALLVGVETVYNDPTTGEEKIANVVPADEDIYAAVKADFPDSKFDRTHLAWYLTQFRKGRFEKDGYGGATGKPMGVLSRDLERTADKVKREAEKAAKAEAAKKAKAEKPVTATATGGAPKLAIVAPSTPAADPLAEFGETPDPATP